MRQCQLTFPSGTDLAPVSCVLLVESHTWNGYRVWIEVTGRADGAAAVFTLIRERLIQQAGEGRPEQPLPLN